MQQEHPHITRHGLATCQAEVSPPDDCLALVDNRPTSPFEMRAAPRRHGRSPFTEVTVSETAARQKQLGRLMRTDEDHGTATILNS